MASERFAKLIEMNKEMYRPKNMERSFTGNSGISVWAAGATGAVFPKAMHGPFGYQTFPIPENQQKMVSPSPNFNSAFGQFPKYNEETFIWRSRFSELPGSVFNTGLNSGLTNGISSLNLKN